MSRYDEHAKLVAQKLIELMKQDLAPWQKGWTAEDAGNAFQMPYNGMSGRPYSGGNAMHLFAVATTQGYDDSRWLTYEQAKKAGMQVRKGEKGTPIAFWDFSKVNKTQESEEGQDGEKQNERRGPSVYFFTVFNGAQIEGMAPLVAREHPSVEWRHGECERLLKESGAEIKHNGGDRAYYRPGTDSIHLPKREAFHSGDDYYATALHEVGHWTGHPSRLARDLSGKFGSEAYAKEELRAEIGSMLLGDRLGIGHSPERHAAYVKHWIKILQDDPKEIFRAASDAEKICKHLGIEAYQREQIQVIERKQELGAERVGDQAFRQEHVNEANGLRGPRTKVRTKEKRQNLAM